MIQYFFVLMIAVKYERDTWVQFSNESNNDPNLITQSKGIAKFLNDIGLQDLYEELMFNQDILKFGLYCILSYLMLICIIGLALIAYSPTPQKAEKVSVLSQILSGLLLLQMRVFHMFESWIVASSIYLYINSD